MTARDWAEAIEVGQVWHERGSDSGFDDDHNRLMRVTGLTNDRVVLRCVFADKPYRPVGYRAVTRISALRLRRHWSRERGLELAVSAEIVSPPE